MSGYFNVQPVPLNASHDYQFRKSTDERRYERLSDAWIEQHRCTFPIEMLSGGFNVVEDFNPCDKSVTFRIPPTKGTGWNFGSINQRYKDLPTPLEESKTFPLWSKLWTQYKIDKYEFMCRGTQEYKAALDSTNMKNLNDLLLGMALRLLNSYQTDFCNCSGTVGTETSPLHIVEGTSTPTDYLFERGDTFGVNCLPGSGYMGLFPLCMRSLFMKDEAINQMWQNCCRDVPPALSGVWPNFIQVINGVTPVFIKDEFFDRFEMTPGVFAYNIPIFHADAFAYKAALMDETNIGPDKEEDGEHFRKSFFFSMNVVHENLVRNDWIVFTKAGLPIYGA